MLRSSGPSARVPPAFEKVVPGEVGEIPIDAQLVQPYYTGALARACGMTISARLEGEEVVIEALTAAAAAA